MSADAAALFVDGCGFKSVFWVWVLKEEGGVDVAL